MVELWALLLGSIEYCIRVSLGIPQALRLKASGPVLLSIGFRLVLGFRVSGLGIQLHIFSGVRLNSL